MCASEHTLRWAHGVTAEQQASFFFFQFLAFDTQMIMGGRKLELNPEEHIFAALQLYMDVVQLFLFILRLIGGRR